MQMKVISFPSDVKTRHVFGWVSILWFTSAVSIAVGEDVKLQTISQVVARCGANVTLTCDASASRELIIKSFSWTGKNKIVCPGVGQPDSEACELSRNTAQPPVHRLTGTLLNVMPVDQGEYLCKLHSTSGAEHNRTNLTVQDCVGSYDSFIDESHAECWFSGVYPIGTIIWFQGEVNITESATTQEKMDHHGRYNVSSTIDVKKGNLNEPYECRLWIPSAGKLLSSQMLPLVEKQIEIRSSGSKVTLQWVCVMVGIVTFMI